MSNFMLVSVWEGDMIRMGWMKIPTAKIGRSLTGNYSKCEISPYYEEGKKDGETLTKISHMLDGCRRIIRAMQSDLFRRIKFQIGHRPDNSPTGTCIDSQGLDPITEGKELQEGMCKLVRKGTPQ